MKNSIPIICADVIAKFNEKYVFIKRKTHPTGLALVGGKQDRGEHLSTSAVREYKEETGLDLEINSTFGVYASVDRDPRGHYVSVVFIGVASGIITEEKNKTEVVLLSEKETMDNINNFVFDHGQFLKIIFNFN